MTIDERLKLLDMFILVVDNDGASIKEILEAQGYTQVQHTASDEKAQDIINKQRVDLLLTTIRASKINGFRLLAHIKRNPKLDHIPVIFTASTGKHGSVVRCIKEGAEDFLGKPFDDALLAARILSSLEKKNLRDREKNLYKSLEDEKKRADTILHNVMPKRILNRMQNGEHHIAEQIDDVSLLFADMCGFTELSSKISPTKLVATLNELFLFMDHLAEEFNLEKIKTIGDNYMLCGGIEDTTRNHPERCVRFAQAAIVGLDRFKMTREMGVSLRIGINTGPVIAGVIGHKRPMFDVWGDTVNLASRMESHGIPNRIQVSEPTFKRLPADLNFQAREKIKVKGSGWMNTYLSPEYIKEESQSHL